MAKDTFYFSHDYNTRNDEKIKKLIRKFNFSGYGIFWGIIEDLYNNNNELSLDFDGLADDFKTTPEVVQSIITDFELFEISNGKFGSISVQRRLSDRDAKSNKAKESASKRWGKSIDNQQLNANALRPVCDGNAIKERKGKEIKESKVNNNRAKALVVQKPEGENQEEIKKDFDKLISDITGKELPVVVTELKNFIHEKMPDFIEPYQEYWNLFAERYQLTQVKVINDSRKRKFKTRVREPDFDFIKVLERIKSSKQLRGTADNSTGWKVTFDWIFENQSNYVKILEGNYDTN